MPRVPDPQVKHPLPNFDRVCFIKNTVKNPNIEIGDYTYFDDPFDSKDFERNVLYHYDFVGDKLKIGKFCAISTGVKFIMNGANHKMDSFSTFPFAIFGADWGEKLKNQEIGAPSKGDTIIGNDVWLGYDSVIMPGVNIGDGAIIASKSVVVSDVPPFSVYGGNPAKLIKKRFDQETIDLLEKINWWNWPYELLTEHLLSVYNNDLSRMKEVSELLK
ncbi:MAG: CatB-related O-acetyltransferase [Desulfobacteraceae bacterium]|nr:CatB-related O-acetyltransferase [Desulfobacteraceae bacterium]